MAEDGDWYAFPGDWRRSQVIEAISDGLGWLEALRTFHVKQGFVWQSEPGWWQECQRDDAGAVPCWLAVARPR